MVVLTDFPPPTEGIHHMEQNITAYVKEQNAGRGSLYIAESRLSWVSNSGRGFSLEYPAISIHAISRDLSAFPHECLYLLLDRAIDDDDDGDDDIDSQEENDEGGNICEVRFVPDNKEMLDVMFNAMSDCQALNPDPNSEGSDEDFVGEEDDEDGGIVCASNFIENGSGDHNGDENGEENPEHEDGNEEENEPMDVGQFDDVLPDH